MKRTISWGMALVLSLSPLLLRAQAPLRTYATQRVQARLVREHAQMVENQLKIERFIARFREEKIVKKVSLPVVFHVLYAPGQAFPGEEQILSQLTVLNDDFSKQKYKIGHPADTIEKFYLKVADTEISFCLAFIDAQGNSTSGINYVSTAVREWSDDDAIKSKARGGADPWDPDLFLNIWVGYLPDTISGYAQMPGGPRATDGIVIDPRFLGTMGMALQPYDGGRTLTHLVGNYLNLYDLWNETAPCIDDYVEDTPIHNAPNHGPTRYKHVSLCGGYPVEMSMNFMDNTDDASAYMFTLGQKYRMQATLAAGGPREKLTNSPFTCRKKDAPLRAENGTNTLSVFSNPASQTIVLRFSVEAEEEIHLLIYNSLGAVEYILKQHLFPGQQEFPVDTHTWSPGVYFIHTHIGGRNAIQKLVIAGK